MKGAFLMSKRVSDEAAGETHPVERGKPLERATQAVRSMLLEQMAVRSHDPNGTHQFKIEDFIDFTGNNKSSHGL
ncbi:hypothetical protein EfmAA610_13840 [Enterococcus faecium]|nr:hypothetical protein EfmAA610_13840 [Enterococcus faecium]